MVILLQWLGCHHQYSAWVNFISSLLILNVNCFIDVLTTCSKIFLKKITVTLSQEKPRLFHKCLKVHYLFNATLPLMPVLNQNTLISMPWLGCLVAALLLWRPCFNPRPVHIGFIVSEQYWERFFYENIGFLLSASLLHSSVIDDI